MFREIVKENISKVIVRSMLESMLRNGMKRGDQLPTEHELCQQFNVSRNAVREALKTLENVGIIESRPKRGNIISLQGADRELLPFLFGAAIDEMGTQNLIELRYFVEHASINLAVVKASDDELNVLMEQALSLDQFRLEMSESDSGNLMAELCDREVAFHQRVIELGKNPFMIKFSVLWPVYFSKIVEQRQLFDPGKKPANKVTHEQIVSAMLRRNKQEASTLLQEHVAFWLEKYEILPEDFLRIFFK